MQFKPGDTCIVLPHQWRGRVLELYAEGDASVEIEWSTFNGDTATTQLIVHQTDLLPEEV